ncbi:MULTISPECIES: oxygenase MpaB family protein [Cellulomonas]|uniref:oxygenase MpaB family protein n=1 Tax=Cellulomonas TaxID=1707 RepID=UPI0010A94D82|nr:MULTISPECIES: oxygenase MpaB family protein [Cellulomonas]
MSVTDPVRRWRARAGTALFLRVAGPHGERSRHRIHHRPGPRWFAPDAAIREVHGDASMFVGGLRSLLLQSLHPAAMAAVADHSGYRADPWGRLSRTSTFLAVTVFGTADDAQAAVDAVRSIHARIRGVTDDGTPYAADDPDLLRWVHVAEIESFLDAHRRYGVRPLTPARADEYVAQAARVGRALGAVDLPETVAGLEAALEGYRPVLRATPAALDAAHFLLREPPVPPVLRVGYGALAGAAVASLPAWAVDGLGLRPVRGVREGAAHWAGRQATRTVRWLLAGQQTASGQAAGTAA